MTLIAPQLPTTPQVVFDRIPKELKGIAAWVLWRYEIRGGKATKVPYNALTGGKAMPNNPTTWTTFQGVSKLADKYSGIGLARVLAVW